MPTIRHIKYSQKTILPLSTCQWLCRTSQTRSLQDHTERRKTIRDFVSQRKLLYSRFSSIPKTHATHHAVGNANPTPPAISNYSKPRSLSESLCSLGTRSFFSFLFAKSCCIFSQRLYHSIS